MSLHRSLLLLLATVVAAACAEAADPVGPETVLAHAVETSRVVGSGHVESAAGLREFTFHAVEHPDGSAAGSFKVVLPSGLFFEADVTCLSVEGTTGWVGGVIRDTNAEIVVIGSTSMFYAIDDGEGGESADVVSTAAFNAAAGADLAFCENRPLELPPMTVTDGNVQVR